MDKNRLLYIHEEEYWKKILNKNKYTVLYTGWEDMAECEWRCGGCLVLQFIAQTWTML